MQIYKKLIKIAINLLIIQILIDINSFLRDKLGNIWDVMFIVIS